MIPQAYGFAPLGGLAEAVQSIRLSWLLFVPLIFFAVRGSFSFQSGGIQEGGFLPGNVSVRETGFLNSFIIPGTVYFTVLLLIKQRWRDVFQLAVNSKALTLVAVMTIVSAAWSQDPSKTLLYGTCYLADTLFAFYLIAAFEADEFLVILNRLMLILSAASILTVLIFPSVGIDHAETRYSSAWEGIFDQRGPAARVTLYLLTASIAMLRSHKDRIRLVAMALGLCLFYKAHAVSAWVLLFVYCLFHLLQLVNRRLAPRTSQALLILALAIGSLFAFSVSEFSSTILLAVGRDPTLTGRTEVWGALSGSILQRPLLGYGFHAFWLGLEGESGNVIRRLNWTFGYAHNGWLEIILQLGTVGFGIFLVTLLQAARNAWICFKYDRNPQNEWYLGVILMTIIYNFDDCTVVWPKDLLSILYIVACCRLALVAAQVRRNRESCVPQANLIQSPRSFVSRIETYRS